jgi:hypothetical protein
MNQLRRTWTVVALTLAWGAGAQEAPPPDPAPAPQERVTVHGYLSQAYGRTEDYQFIGIPANGTFDYRRAALLFRADVTDADTFVVQLAQRRLGRSPAMQVEPDVKLDWAFYEHRFAHGTSLRVGRIPSPLGIYSEIRYVGTLLPLYRAPFNFYQEGSFTSENINGVKLTQTIASSKPWNAEVHLFGGGLRMTEAFGGRVSTAHSENVLGGQIWLNTPLDGLRVGLGGQFFDLHGTILNATGEDRMKTWVAAFDLTRPRFRLRSEYSEIRFDSTNFVAPEYYVYGGVNLTDKLVAHGQWDHGDAHSEPQPASLRIEYPDLYSDWTVGLSYALRPDVVFKAEQHWIKSRLREDKVVLFAAPAVSTSYFLLSLSASF